jgi:hypothetical protein
LQGIWLAMMFTEACPLRLSAGGSAAVGGPGGPVPGHQGVRDRGVTVRECLGQQTIAAARPTSQQT